MDGTNETTGAAAAPETGETSTAAPATPWIAQALEPTMLYTMKIGAATVEFDFNRPLTFADFTRFGEAGALAFVEGESRLDGMLGGLAAFVTDVRGIPDFEPKRDSESLVDFRSRFSVYFSAAKAALVPLFFAFNSDAAPSVERRASFRPH